MTMEVNGVVLSDRTVSYLGTAMWSSTVMLPVAEDERVDGCMDVDDDHPLHGISEDDNIDDHFDIHDFTEESLRKAEFDCNNFFHDIGYAGLVDKAERFADDDHIAHDFWLTRNGHGAGFWDGDYEDRDDPSDDCGDELTELCKDYGEQHIWCDEDGCIHLEDG
jgi:hypothetical protein